MKIGVLTSSRADYGIYIPLLEKMKKDSFFSLEIIAFGTHLSKGHGYTLSEIEKDKYSKIHSISSLVSNDDEQSIATSYALTALKFSDFWHHNKYDLVFCLGDRFEMSSAVQAGIPQGVKFAHIHGGETTLGAIDNVYRHQISLASSIHFTSTNSYKEKVIELTGNKKNVYSVGSLSLDSIIKYKPLKKQTFLSSYNIKNEEFALITFHPETLNPDRNYKYADEMKRALRDIIKTINIVITMPNADTLGSIYRQKIEELKNEYSEKVVLIENFGKINYFSAMYYAKVLIGNTSSGILEAASFKKFVVNVGDRQKGRVQSENILNAKFSKNDIVNKFELAIDKGQYAGENIYYHPGPGSSIVKIIKNTL